MSLPDEAGVRIKVPGPGSKSTEPSNAPVVKTFPFTSIAMPYIMPHDSYKEGPPDGGEDMQKSMEPLEGKNPIVMTMEELQAKWIDICIEQSRPQDMDSFSLLNVLPLVVREHEYVVFDVGVVMGMTDVTEPVSSDPKSARDRL